MHARRAHACYRICMHNHSCTHTHSTPPQNTPVPSESAQSVCACVPLVCSGVRNDSHRFARHWDAVRTQVSFKRGRESVTSPLQTANRQRGAHVMSSFRRLRSSSNAVTKFLSLDLQYFRTHVNRRTRSRADSHTLGPAFVYVTRSAREDGLLSTVSLAPPPCVPAIFLFFLDT